VQLGSGGVLMGSGAEIALSRSISTFFSAIPSPALNGWVFDATLALGTLVGCRY